MHDLPNVHDRIGEVMIYSLRPVCDNSKATKFY
jgi:hypothetical protein